ncbi:MULTISPECIES: DUF3168 domain-containing protein [unclassified Paracoccus (in: a-proteobacteria)]|uniref:DUF3168 domain-containing protein n=1 Tax=unclassified Paracoccus (in: a-proteobacteria) TaxID=2688777 RepID=UPI0012B3BA5E|nr:MULTISPECIES: DUF3168 domain-containing protein [unclassified Paracoccus (in: a-proteobacteria)]UXU74974.1 DUF3168 domain-containing protein [Paracoccus sp. SMMA_5]UXU80877.1 DUF3168 domain-containing protein [Paracoccus sp. SMMA_5_TC]
MSYAATVALQAAVYERLCGDTELSALVGDAIYDAMPVQAPPGPYVSLGPEEVRDAGDITAGGAVHEFVVSVLSEGSDSSGFHALKAAAAAVSDALDGADIALAQGRLVGMWFLRAKARRTGNGTGRRVDLTFRARIDLG